MTDDCGRAEGVPHEILPEILTLGHLVDQRPVLAFVEPNFGRRKVALDLKDELLQFVEKVFFEVIGFRQTSNDFDEIRFLTSRLESFVHVQEEAIVQLSFRLKNRRGIFLMFQRHLAQYVLHGLQDLPLEKRALFIFSSIFPVSGLPSVNLLLIKPDSPVQNQMEAGLTYLPLLEDSLIR